MSADVRIYQLDSGAHAVVMPRRGTPLVSIALAARGGVLNENVEQAGLTALAARASLKGTENRSAAQLAEETEALGGSISPSVGSDHLLWSISLPARHLGRAFALLADAVLRPIFPAEELETERKVALSDLAQTRDDMYRFPQHLFFHAAYAGHPYGYGIEQLEAALRRHARDDVADWHARRVGASELWAFVVGDVDADAAALIVERELRSAPRGDAPSAPPAPPAWPVAPRSEVVAREKAQTALALGFPGPDRNHEDAHALQVLSNAVSGLGGRLFEELRDRRSLAYTVSAYPVLRWQAGAFVGYIATAPQREDEARAGLLAEFARMREVGVDAEDVERSKRYTIGTHRIRGQSNAAQLGELAGVLLLGDALEEIERFEERIRAVTPERVRDVAARYFDLDRVVQGIVRGRG